jgi:exodeoxyribonuclease VII small subunit
MSKRKSSETQAESPASFEESLNELQTIVMELEDGSLGLETSLARFERGIGLLRTCYSILETAETKVEILTRFNGEEPPTTAPFENTATLRPAQERNITTKDDAEEEINSDRSAVSKEDSSKSSLF